MKINQLLARLAYIIIDTIIMVFICASVGMSVFIRYYSNQTFAKGASIAAAIAVWIYIKSHHKIAPIFKEEKNEQRRKK